MQSNNLVILLQELLKFQEIKELVLFYRKKYSPTNFYFGKKNH